MSKILVKVNESQTENFNSLVSEIKEKTVANENTETGEKESRILSVEKTESFREYEYYVVECAYHSRLIVTDILKNNGYDVIG